VATASVVTGTTEGGGFPVGGAGAVVPGGYRDDRDEIDVADSRIEATETAEQPEGGEDQGMKRTPRVGRSRGLRGGGQNPDPGWPFRADWSGISAKCAPARGSRHTDARSFVPHPDTRGTFPDAGGDGSGRYSSSSHSRPDRFRRTGPHPDTAARIRRLGVASASTGPTAPASAGPTEPASTVALIPTTTPSGEPAATPLASGNADAGGVDREHPTREPCPLGAVTTPIIEDVAFVGGPPAYSADGQWVAFSARPSNGALGPDIDVWHVDDAKARPLTTDHSSVFSAWDVDQILGSVLPSGTRFRRPRSSRSRRPSPPNHPRPLLARSDRTCDAPRERDRMVHGGVVVKSDQHGPVWPRPRVARRRGRGDRSGRTKLDTFNRRTWGYGAGSGQPRILEREARRLIGVAG